MPKREKTRLKRTTIFRPTTMNLFWKKLFGKLTSTAKFEAELQQKHDAFIRYQKVKESDELKEYNRLFDIVSSPDFKEKKKLLTSRKYKDTIEFRDKNKYNKLRNKESLRKYLSVAKSMELEDYLKFKNSEDYHLLSKEDGVRKSPQLSALKRFEQSEDYKVYMRFHDSYILKEYEELKRTVETEEFQKNDAFWANPDRWFLTEESKIEKKFKELAHSDDIRFFLHHNEGDFKELLTHDLVLEEQFDGTELDTERWATGFCLKSPELKKDYSYIDERQAYNQGKNTTVNNKLKIKTKEEKIVAPAWHPQKGFINKEYNFTSDNIHLKKLKLSEKDTIVVKAKFEGAKGVNHAICLSRDNQLPSIDICHRKDGKMEVGIYQKQQNSVIRKSERITGIDLDDYFIYTVRLENNTLVWYINNMEVYSLELAACDNLTLNILSYIPENNKGGESDLKVDWIKIYHRH